MKFRFAAILVTVVLSCVLPARAAEPLDLQTRFGRFHTDIVIQADGTAVETVEWSKTILKQSALESAKEASIAFSTSAQTGEIVAAYTLKPDGRRIDVRKDNFQIEVNRGQGQELPAFSDHTSMSVVFPELAVGDTVVFAYRIAQTEPIFPGHYSTTQIYYDQVAYDDVRVRIDWPESLWVQYAARDMTETAKATANGRNTIEWRYAHPSPVKSERRDFSVFDPEQVPGFAFSTFKSHADIARAYAVRALPKAVPDERIKALAAEIVGDRKDATDQARALYDWVATNITYAGNCIGIGGVVPRDLAFVIDNRMGDCKDHATLLQALLAARGIAATQVLVNAGNVYRLPKIPVVNMVNHVINYLPDLNLYLDSTASDVPFGMLPLSIQDKPTLLVEGARDDSRTPIPAVGGNQEQMRAALRIADNGALSGTVEVTQVGIGAISARRWARDLTKEAEDDLIKNMLRSKSLVGTGKIDKDDPSALTDRYHYKVSLQAEKFMKVGGAGAFYIVPPLGIGASLVNMLGVTEHLETEADVSCGSGRAVEDYVYELPKRMKILSLPPDIKIGNKIVSYTATYKQKGSKLMVHRELDDRTPMKLCSPEIMKQFRDIADQAFENIKEPVLYK